MEHPRYNNGSRNSAALAYINRKYTRANTKVEESSIWHPIQSIKNLIEFGFWKKQWELGCKEIEIFHMKLVSQKK
jgi:hypothetical protein